MKTDDKLSELTINDMQNALNNLRNMLLKREPHIKKYYKYRKLHSEIIESMENYFVSGKYNLKGQLNNAVPVILKELNGNRAKFKFKFDGRNEDDVNILNEIAIYKNHKDITSITEEYIEKNKFKNEEKVKMLTSMNNSYVGLFKITNIDSYNAYVELEDVFTKKKFTIIDIALSGTVKEPNSTYIYNRIITYDGISFGTGIHIVFAKGNKTLTNYIRNNKNKRQSSLLRCLDLYEIYKKSDIKLVPNHNYE